LNRSHGIRNLRGMLVRVNAKKGLVSGAMVNVGAWQRPKGDTIPLFALPLPHVRFSTSVSMVLMRDRMNAGLPSLGTGISATTPS
jgi:hypothetical protein